MTFTRPTQAAPHERLPEIVAKHLGNVWQRPIADHTRAAFTTVARRLKELPTGTDLILDSCCGTGESTGHIAARFPDAMVVGIDKSADRLSRQPMSAGGNHLIIRADVNDFWRLAAAAGWQPARHFLLYPNPYPKMSQVRKRWHASPAFPSLLALGGQLTVRSNWQVYAQEFVIALAAAGISASLVELPTVTPMTAFERKYQARGEALFEVTADLNR